MVGKSVMENGELYGRRFLRPLQVQEDLQGELQVSQGTSLCALMDSVMTTELTARPNTNSGRHYMPNYMYRVYYLSHSISRLDSKLQLHVSFTGKCRLVIRIAYLTA